MSLTGMHMHQVALEFLILVFILVWYTFSATIFFLIMFEESIRRLLSWLGW